MKISIIGAGNVGSTTAKLILQKGLGKVVLIDVVEGLAEGKSLDLAQMASIEGFSPDIKGTTSYEETANSEIILITAGVARKPGLSRLDLLKKNLEIIKQVIEAILKYSSNPIIIMMTNPVDILTYFALKLSDLPSTRVMGQGGVLDTARYKYFLGIQLGVNPYLVEGMVIGEHNTNMIPVISHTKYKDRPIKELLPPQVLEVIVEKTRNGGAQIVNLLKTGSAYYTPASALNRIVECIVNDTKELLPVSAYINDKYGINDVCLGVPTRLGKNGIEEIVELPLSEEELSQLRKSAERCKQVYKELWVD